MQHHIHDLKVHLLRRRARQLFPVSHGSPLLATFKDGSDNHAILAFKTVGMGETYAYGIPIPVLKEWTPPRSHSEEMKEECLLVSTKLSDGRRSSRSLC